MAKRLFLLLISGLIGIVMAPDFLMATDDVQIAAPVFDDVLTEEIVEETPVAYEEPVEEAIYYESVYEEPVYKEPVYEEPIYYAPANTISIAGKYLEVVDVDSTLDDSGEHVNKYGDRFLYGHNSWNVFGSLVNLGVGETFSVYYGGVNQNYQISKIVIYEKNANTGKLQINGEGSYMNAVAKAKNSGVQYDLSIMTCYGTSYGNGDASHRLVIFANAI